MEVVMITLYFSKRFISGLLSGITYHGFMHFVSYEVANSWVKAVKNNRKLNFNLVDATFQARRVDSK